VVCDNALASESSVVGAVGSCLDNPMVPNDVSHWLPKCGEGHLVRERRLVVLICDNCLGSESYVLGTADPGIENSIGSDDRPFKSVSLPGLSYRLPISLDCRSCFNRRESVILICGYLTDWAEVQGSNLSL
jgi:hypothetical protein